MDEVKNSNSNQSQLTTKSNSGKRVAKVTKRLFLGVLGVACVSGASIGVYALLSNNSLPATEVSAKGVDVADSFDFDCEAQEVIGEDDGNGVFCSEQKITGTLPSDGEVVLKDADKYEINGNNFTRTISYEFPQETYNAETLDIETVKAGQDDEIEITLLDGDTGEVLATKTVKVHYSISDEDVDKIIHYSITISNITVEQIQQVLVQNNPGYTTEDIERIIQEREDRIAAEKEAKRQKELEEAQKRAEEARKEQARNNLVNSQAYTVWVYPREFCNEKDYGQGKTTINDYTYEFKVGCARRNSSPYAVGKSDAQNDFIEIIFSIESGLFSNTPLPDVEEPLRACDVLPAEERWKCREDRETWQEYHQSVGKEHDEQYKMLTDRSVLRHSLGQSYTSKEGSLQFTVPKGASNFQLDINGAVIPISIALDYPLTFEKLLPRLPSHVQVPDELK